MVKPHVLILNLTDKIDLTRSEESFALTNLSIYYTWKNIKSSYKNSTFRISAPKLKDEFELAHELNSISDIQD